MIFDIYIYKGGFFYYIAPAPEEGSRQGMAEFITALQQPTLMDASTNSVGQLTLVSQELCPER